jgi:hypothetical protein
VESDHYANAGLKITNIKIMNKIMNKTMSKNERIEFINEYFNGQLVGISDSHRPNLIVLDNVLEHINDLKSYIVNIYKTVLYRGIKGVYIYACNNNLKQYLRKHLNISQDIDLINDAKSNKPRIIPFESLQPFVNAVPIYNIKVAATNFTDPQFYEEFSWAELPMQVSPKPGYFIAQVIGESMNKKIPNGSYCLFEEYTAGSRNREIVLAECTSIQDSSYGSGYTIKEYNSIKSITEDSFIHNSIVLKPLSYDDSFEDIILTEEETVVLKVKGIFKKVLDWSTE